MAAVDATGASSVSFDDIYDVQDWWSDDRRGLRQLRKLVPARFAYLDRVVVDWRGLKTLDLGCGGGFMAEALARRGALVTGVDPGPAAIASARHHAESEGLAIDYWVGHGEALHFKAASFDLVVCVDVFEHVDDLDLELNEIRRILAPGGLLFLDTISRTRLAAFIMVTMAERVLRLLPTGTHDPARFVAPSDLRARLVALGFDVAPFAGFGPRALDLEGDFRFGWLPTLAILFMGHARLI